MTGDRIILTDPDRDRYFSSRLIPWWNQARLVDAQVMIVGAGALGNEVLKNFALLGVGRLFIVDFDRIEVANLGRSVLFRRRDAGRPKAEVAAERVRELNPDVRVKSFVGDVTRDLGLGVFRRMDVVVGCLDNREARWAVNRACWKVGKPWVDGGLESLNGTVKVFVPPDGACYECGLTESDFRVMSLRSSCPGLLMQDVVKGRVPTVITSAAIIAGVQTQEVVKLIHGIPVVPGSAFLYNGVVGRSEHVTLARRPGCGAHEACAEVVEVQSSVKGLTLGGLLQVAQERLGGNAYLHLDRELLLRWVCAVCGSAEWVVRSYDGMLLEGPVCEACGEHKYPELSHVVSEGSPYLTATLSDAGVPPLHMVAARAGERAVYLEMAGDAPDLLAYEGEGDT